MSDPPAAAAVRERLVALAAALRARGVRVGSGEVESGARALAAVDAGSREDARLALRAVLCSRRDDLAAFDDAFAAVFGAADAARRSGGEWPPGAEALPVTPRVAVPPGTVPREQREELEVRPAAYSDIELLLDRDFATYSDAERALARAVLRRLARRGPTRRSRRLRPSRRRGHRPDLQRTVRASLRHGGEPVHRHWRAPGIVARPVVFVVDVSGSMAPYARMLLQYVQAAVAARRRVEAFALGTRLTRITRELHTRDVDRALARATAAVADFGGGTRIGEGLAELNRVHGRRLGRGAVVVVLSDGWDRGDPAVLSAEMARLARSAHRVVWLNPLKAQRGYEPLARGMAAALPHVDAFLEGHSLRSLAELAALLEGPLSDQGERR
ncbi:MAG TPA: VWA domain-containing protein [Solirubrobacteraceae bacterium]|nr:VWA domain-containing protein [Solirubrobacteraceae bacterium]